jgi:hypothetical protein
MATLRWVCRVQLCLGRPNDETCLVVCFQSFELPLKREKLDDDHKGAPKDRPTIKGGFLLPAEIRCAEIIDDSEETPLLQLARRERGSLEIRRSRLISGVPPISKIADDPADPSTSLESLHTCLSTSVITINTTNHQVFSANNHIYCLCFGGCKFSIGRVST